MVGRTLDPYAVLGVPREATPLQVARAHRRLAKRHHPDLHEGATDAADRMRRINEAWWVLSSPARRADYDAAHPAVRAPAGTHWGPTRSPIQPAAPSSTRTWATWRATAAETRAAPRTVRQPGEAAPIPRTRRPSRAEPTPATFRDSGWAAVLAAALFLFILVGAIIVGRITL